MSQLPKYSVGKLRLKVNKIPLKTSTMFENLKMRATQLGMIAAANSPGIRRR